MSNHQLTLYDSETVFGSQAVDYFRTNFLVNDITLQGEVRANRTSSGEYEAQYTARPTPETVERLRRRGLSPFGYTDPLPINGFDSQREAEDHVSDALAILASAVEEKDSLGQLATRVDGDRLTIFRK